LPEEIAHLASRGFDIVSKGASEVEWPMLAGREWFWTKGGFEIEPGEEDSLHTDFLAPQESRVAQFYFYLRNARKRKQGLGWTLTVIYDLKEQTVGEKKAAVIRAPQQEEKQQQQQQQQQAIQEKPGQKK
jgi:hypothetical protein